MASDAIRMFHAEQMAQERQRVMERIAYGTKASSPDIRNLRRQNPLYYSNPLPDNSTGSKNRPFGLNKDESGRPNAMELVAMRQSGELVGGVLKDYRYARSILDRRARDTNNLDLEAQGLPAQPAPMVELTERDSRSIELNNLLQNVQIAVEQGNIRELTLQELKNIPRLLIALVPGMNESEIASLIEYLEDDIITELTQNLPRTETNAPSKRVLEYFNNVVMFLKNAIRLVGREPITVQRGIVALAKDFFGSRTPPKNIVVPKGDERMDVEESRGMERTIQRAMPDVEEEEEEEEEGPRETEEERKERIIGENFDLLEALQIAYRQKPVVRDELERLAVQLGASPIKVRNAYGDAKVVNLALKAIGLPSNLIQKKRSILDQYQRNEEEEEEEE